jgi:hypothetical protein
MQTLMERGGGPDAHQATVVTCLLHMMRDGRVNGAIATLRIRSSLVSGSGSLGLHLSTAR